MSSGDDIREHMNKFIEIVDKLAEMDINVHKELQSAMLLNSFCPKGLKILDVQ